MKKMTTLAVVAVMTAFGGLGGGQALANTLVVDDGTECPGAPFATIGAALAGASSGDTIEVCPGVYGEAVTISLSGVTLTGTPAPGAILDGTALADTDNCITIAVGVSDVTIERLEIRNCNNRGIRGLGMHSSIKLRDLDIHAVSQVAGDGHAVDFESSDDVKIEHVSIAVGPGAGFFAEAIRLQSVSDVVVDHVHIVGGFVGVNFACSGPCAGPEPPTNGVVTSSTISGTTDNGVLLANTTNATIEGNMIAGAAFAGIQVGFRTENPVTGAKIISNLVTGTGAGGFGAGIALARGSSGSTVRGNLVTGSVGAGVFVGVVPGPGGSSSGNTIEQNVSNGNTGFGYFDGTAAAAANVFIGNECKANTAGGSSGPGGLGTLCGPQF